MRSRAGQYIAVLILCLAVYWPMLSVTGFGSTEGHRVGPAWEMLETGDWTHLRLFGQTYLRKPPGMPWAIAVSSSIFGQTEFAARAVSALASTLMALIACAFTRRWLGGRWGLAGGFAQALAPLFVSAGRTAEIDSLNALGTQVAALAMISLLAPPRSAQVPNAQCLLPKSSLFLAIGLIIAGIAKGPASLTVFLGIPLAACIQVRSIAPLRSKGLWLGGGAAGLVLAGFAAWFARANATNGAVTQDFTEFTWSASRLAGTAMLVPASVLAGFPTSMALIALLVHRADPPERRDEHVGLASLLALSWLCSVALLMLVGSSNPRYAMPAGVLVAPLVAWAIRACWLARHRSIIARLALFGHPLFLLAVVVALVFLWMGLDLQRPRHAEGRAAGAAIAGVLPDDSIIWANDMVEARPDVPLYAQQSAERAGRTLRTIWRKPQLLGGAIPPAESKVYLLLRDDAESGEAARYRQSGARLEEVAAGAVAQYRWVLFRVVGESMDGVSP